MEFLSHGPYFSNTKRVLKFWILCQNQKLLYPNQEPVEFDNILRYGYKIRKENHFVEEYIFDFK